MVFGASNTARQLSVLRWVGQTEFGSAVPLCDEALIGLVESHFLRKIRRVAEQIFGVISLAKKNWRKEFQLVPQRDTAEWSAVPKDRDVRGIVSPIRAGKEGRNPKAGFADLSDN